MLKPNLSSITMLMGASLLTLVSPPSPSLSQPYICSDVALGTNFNETTSYDHQNNYLQQNNVRTNSGASTNYNQQQNVVAYDRSRTGGFENENSGQFSNASANQSSSSDYRTYNKGGGGSTSVNVTVPTPTGVPVGVGGAMAGSGYTMGTNGQSNSQSNSNYASGAFDQDRRGYGTQNHIYSGDTSSTNQGSSQFYSHTDTGFTRDTGYQRGGRNTQSTVVAGRDCRDVNYYQHQDRSQMINKSFEHRDRQVTGNQNSNQYGRQSLNQFMSF